MKRLVALPVLVLAAPVFAHPGHIAGAAGHSHWLALAALAAAVAIAAVGIARVALRRRRPVLND